MTRAQGKHREFSLNQSVATLYLHLQSTIANLIFTFNLSWVRPSMQLIWLT